VKTERVNERTRSFFIREFLLELYSCAYIDEAARPNGYPV
jgi:hypothetical protein